jgi:hypothetical protein
MPNEPNFSCRGHLPGRCVAATPSALVDNDLSSTEAEWPSFVAEHAGRSADDIEEELIQCGDPLVSALPTGQDTKMPRTVRPAAGRMLSRLP